MKSEHRAEILRAWKEDARGNLNNIPQWLIDYTEKNASVDLSEAMTYLHEVIIKAH